MDSQSNNHKMYQGIALIDANIIRNHFTSTGKTGNCAELSFFQSATASPDGSGF